MVKFILSILFICLSQTNTFSQTAAETTLPAGKVIEKVAVQADAAQSYAVYLPKNYSLRSKWAAIFCFDPGGRGKYAVERFQAAAEKYNYIVVCSNNSRNGLDGAILQRVLDGFWQDAHLRFNIDEKRTYAAGFSRRFAARFELCGRLR